MRRRYEEDHPLWLRPTAALGVWELLEPVATEDLSEFGLGPLGAAEELLAKYIDFSSNERPHQALGYRTPSDVYAER